jgi:hypothetical protein
MEGGGGSVGVEDGVAASSRVGESEEMSSADRARVTPSQAAKENPTSAQTATRKEIESVEKSGRIGVFIVRRTPV